MNEISDRIRSLCKQIGKDLAELHKGDTMSALWPFVTNEAEFYIGSFFMKQLYETLTSLKKEGYTKEQIARLLEHPSKVSQYLTMLHSANILRVEQRLQLTEDLLDYISYFRQDPLCKNKTNPLNPNTFDMDILSTSLKESFLNNEKELSALMLLYLEILYPTLMRLGHEIHGPYETKSGKMLIKEFFCLTPKYFKEVSSFPFQKITLLEHIENNPRLDIFNHQLKSPKKTKAAIIADGKLLDETSTTTATNSIKNSIQKINNAVSGFSKKDWIKHLAYGIFFSIKKLRDELGLQWEPPNDLFKKIDSEDFNFNMESAKKFNELTPQDILAEKISSSFLKVFNDENS